MTLPLPLLSIRYVALRRIRLGIFALLCCLFMVTRSIALELTNDVGGTYGWSVAQSTAIAPACLQFTIVGVCIWIICTNVGCDVDVTIKYGHFNPEAFVEVTNPQGVDRAEDPKRGDTHNRNHNNLISQDAAVFGHPLTGEIYCPSHSSPGVPYFFSRLDIPTWRWGGLDTFMPGALIPGIHEIGRWPLNTWAALYPRTGWTVQSSPPKSAGVVAQRAGDIVTRTGEPHLYHPITGLPIFVADNKFTWAPIKGLTENTNRFGWFQPYFPIVEPKCVLFGANDLLALTDWGGGRISQSGDYAYTLYRPYTCCQIDDGFLIAIDFVPFPVIVVTN